MDSTTYIALLPQSIQFGIRQDLIKVGLRGAELQVALSGRLCDLEDTIDIHKFMKSFK